MQIFLLLWCQRLVRRLRAGGAWFAFLTPCLSVGFEYTCVYRRGCVARGELICHVLLMALASDRCQILVGLLATQVIVGTVGGEEVLHRSVTRKGWCWSRLLVDIKGSDKFAISAYSACTKRFNNFNLRRHCFSLVLLWIFISQKFNRNCWWHSTWLLPFMFLF